MDERVNDSVYLAGKIEALEEKNPGAMGDDAKRLWEAQRNQTVALLHIARQLALLNERYHSCSIIS